MAGQGRHRKPARLKALPGGKTEATQGAVIAPRRVDIPAPEIVADDPVAFECWQWVASNMKQLGYLEQLDRDVLTLYCLTMSTALEAHEKIKESGLVVTAGPNNYPIKNPYLQVRDKAIEQLNRMGLQLGWSPVARARLLGDQLPLPLNDGEDAETDRFSVFLAATAR